MKLIETKTITVAAASIEFTSIPQDATDLVVLVSGRAAASFLLVSGGLFLNSAAADTSWRRLTGDGSVVNSGSATGATDFFFGNLPGATATSNTFSNITIYIPNYTGSQQKSLSSDCVSENNGSTAELFISAGLCTKTAAVTSLTVRIYGGASNLAAGTTVSLYKVTKGTDGIVTVS